jgi:hypothetical protein
LGKQIIRGEKEMAIKVKWGMLGIGSILAFIIGWFLFGLIGAVVLAIIVMLLLGIIKIS